MPSKSPAQARFMAAVAHNPRFAAKVGVPQSVGKEFNDHDNAKEVPHKAKAETYAKVLRGYK